jgi:hypothetical protein
MLVPFSQVRPGDKFRWNGMRFVKVYGCGEANCCQMFDDPRENSFAKIPWESMVEVPPFDTEENYVPTSDEIAEQEEYDRRGTRMLDRIKSGELDNPLDQETDQWQKKN